MCSSPGACNVNANFTASSTTICSNGTVSFTNTSTGSTTQTWLVNGTSFSSSVNATRTFPNAGTYEIKLIASNGTCTDTNTVTILVSSPTTASISNASCQSFTWPVNGQTYSQSGVYYATISNAAGCDSIITLNLTINQPTNTSETIINCGNYTWPVNGQTYTQSGTYTSTFTNASGCLSTKTLYLTINQPTNTSETIINCGNYTWPENGQTYTQSGTYTSTFTNASGCLSTKTLILTINQTSSSVLTETALDSYVLNGQTYTQSGTYTQVLPNSAGCDSTITLNLTLDFTGISESVERSVIVFPNPTNDLLNVIIPTDSEEHYVLFDCRGRTLLEGRLNGTLSQISLKELPIGSYFLQVGNERFPLNVLKQ
jgi:hypothetical protein